MKKSWLWAVSVLIALVPSFLAANESLEQSFHTDNFSIIYDGNNGVAVYHAQDLNHPLWQTAKDGRFFETAIGNETVDSSRGSFVFKDSIQKKCKGAQITDIFESENKVEVHGVLTDCNLPFAIFFEEAMSDHLRFETILFPQSSWQFDINRTTLRYLSSSDEGFYGFGHQYNVLNMKGRRLPIWCQEQGHGRGKQPLTWFLSTFAGGAAGDWYTSYTQVPFYLSTKGRGVMLENLEYITFDFTRNDETAIELYSDSMRGRIIAGDTPKDIVSSYTKYSGRMDPLPAWTQEGAVVRARGGSAAVRDAVIELQNADAAFSAIWIEDWAGERETIFGKRMWWNWVVDRSKYPDFEQLVAELKAQGIRVLSYFNPFLMDVSTKKDAERNLFKEAAENGYLVKNKQSNIYMVGNGGFEAGVIDLTNPDARRWIKDIMVEQLELGISGWMADFGEALAYDAVLYSGADPKNYHNQFPYEWAKLNREAFEEAGVLGEAVFFNRSGNAKSPGISTLFWIGDQLVTWDDYDGFQTVIPALLSGGLSGYSLNHTDTGGWLSIMFPFVKCQRSKELLLRWMELSVFTPFFRLHHSNQPDKNYQYNSDPDTLRQFARLTKIYKALGTYKTRLMEEAATYGYPVIRHPMLHYPNDKNVYSLKQQFMLGSEMMVAPVVQNRARSVKLYLPKGRWVHLWTGAVVDTEDAGKWIEVDAPIGEPAVFYLEGSSAGTHLVDELNRLGVL